MNADDKRAVRAAIARETRSSPWTMATWIWVGIASVVLLRAAIGCTNLEATQVRCKLAALEELPDEPDQVTVSDVVQVVEHVRRCSRGADAGR